MSTCLNVFCSFFLFLWLLLSIFSTTSDVFVSLQVPKAILMGSLAAFVGVIKKKKKTLLGLARVFFRSADSPVRAAAGGGVLPGEVVLAAVRGQHLGAEG